MKYLLCIRHNSNILVSQLRHKMIRLKQDPKFFQCHSILPERDMLDKKNDGPSNSTF